MNYTTLGGSNLKVSRFCLGTMMFGGKTTAEESQRIVLNAFDGGINFFDTADAYENGETEKITGKALKGIREKVVLASKVGMKMGDGPNDTGVSRYHIIRGVEASLDRLKTDRIDLLYIHWPFERMNLEEMVAALDSLMRTGKILYPACSNFPAWLACRTMWLQDISGCTQMVAGQYPYNLIERGLEVEVLPFAYAIQMAIVVYRPLCIGLLTGKYNEGIPAGSRGTSDQRIQNWSKKYNEGLGKLSRFAEGRGYACSDAAIAWVCSHPAVTSAIAGISSLDQLEANMRSFEWEMSEEDRREISGFFPTAVWEEEGGGFPGWRRSYEIVPSQA